MALQNVKVLVTSGMGDENVETVVPEARGKAEAMRTFLATGEGLVSRGSSRNPQFRYQKGKLKGKTQDEAKSMFESMWASAPGAIKDKYAKMAGPEGTLSPSEMEGLGTGHEGPKPGLVYGSTKVTPDAPGRPSPAPSSNIKSGGAVGAGGLGATRMLNGGKSGIGRSGIPGVTPGAVGPPAPDVQDALDRRSGAIAGSTPAPPPFVGPPAPESSPSESGLSPLAQRELDKRRSAVDNTPTGAPVMDRRSAMLEGVAAKKSVNRLTGLPFGYQPGDKLPGAADGAMQSRAAESVKRMEVNESKAAMAPQGKPFTGISPQTAGGGEKSKTGYAGPKTRYTPGMGEVPVAQPVKNGDEIISYDAYDTARTRAKSPGSTVEQDRKDRAIQFEFERQQQARRKKPGGSLAGDYAKNRTVSR